VLALMVVLSFSRGATLLMAVMTTAFGGWLSWDFFSRRRWPILPFAGAALMLAAGLLVAGFYALQLGHTTERFQDLFAKDRHWSIDARRTAAQATWEMATARPLTGWGAGCFRFLFPLYSQHHPSIATPPWDVGKSFFWEHAHNDWLQFLAELGVLGCAPLVALLGLWLVKLIRARAWKNPPLGLTVLGLGLLLAHCWIDFPLQNPAILVTACALGAATGRWAEIETRRNTRQNETRHAG
jgi:O-antigen ligase